jgi:hypothetical protein
MKAKRSIKGKGQENTEGENYLTERKKTERQTVIVATYL